MKNTNLLLICVSHPLAFFYVLISAAVYFIVHFTRN